MPYGDQITDAELDIMKILWEREGLTSPAIFESLSNSDERNTGTLKTLLKRLVKKGAVRREGINERHYIYFPVITEKEYIKKNRRRLIDRMFDGSAKGLLLNLVNEEKITREDLEQMISRIEEKK